MVLSPTQRRKLSIKSVLVTVIAILKQISACIIDIEFKDILNILQTVAFLRTLTTAQDSSLKLSECCQNFFVRINFSSDLIIPHDVKNTSFILLHIMSSWSFSRSQYESIKKLLTEEIKLTVANRQRITDIVRGSETVYISHLLQVARLYQPLFEHLRDDSGQVEVASGCRLSFLIFYLLKMTLKLCQLKVAEFSPENVCVVGQLVPQMISHVVGLHEVIFQEIYLNEFISLFAAKHVNRQVWLTFLFEILRQFDFSRIRQKIWDSLFETVLSFVEDFLELRRVNLDRTVFDLRIFEDDQKVPDVNQFHPFKTSPTFSPKPDDALLTATESLKEIRKFSPKKQVASKDAKRGRKGPKNYLEAFNQDHSDFRFIGPDSVLERSFDFVFSVVTGNFKLVRGRERESKGVYSSLVLASLRVLLGLVEFTFAKFDKNQKFRVNKVISNNIKMVSHFRRNADLLFSSAQADPPPHGFALLGQLYNPRYEHLFKRFSVSHQGFTNLMFLELFLKELEIRFNQANGNAKIAKKLVIENLVRMSRISDRYKMILNSLTQLEQLQAKEEALRHPSRSEARVTGRDGRTDQGGQRQVGPDRVPQDGQSAEGNQFADPVAVDVHQAYRLDQGSQALLTGRMMPWGGTRRKQY